MKLWALFLSGFTLVMALASSPAWAALVGIRYEFTTSFGGAELLGVNVKGTAIYRLDQDDLTPGDTVSGTYELLSHSLELNNTIIAIAKQAPLGPPSVGQDFSRVSIVNDAGGSFGFDAFRLDSTFNEPFMGTTINLSGLYAAGPTSVFASKDLVAPDPNLLPDDRQGTLQYVTAAGQQITSFGLLTRFDVYAVPETVAIDIKPGNDKNCFKQNGKGSISVAVLGDATFDPTSIDISTLDFSGLSVAVKGNGQIQCDIDDVDSDGLWDLECKFADSENWNGGPDEATLTGELYDGSEFEGTDSICIK